MQFKTFNITGGKTTPTQHLNLHYAAICNVGTRHSTRHP